MPRLALKVTFRNINNLDIVTDCITVTLNPELPMPKQLFLSASVIKIIGTLEEKKKKSGMESKWVEWKVNGGMESKWVE